MKEWKKPEIVDLDVKFTENVTFCTSGPDSVPIKPPGRLVCLLCGYRANSLNDLFNKENHNDNCPYKKGHKNLEYSSID